MLKKSFLLAVCIMNLCVLAQAGTKEALDLARQRLDISMQHMSEYPHQAFWQRVKDLRAAFDNPFSIRSANCHDEAAVMFTQKKNYYLAQDSSNKKNIIYICKGYKPQPDLMAQDFIHETSHVALNTMEDQATELEMVVTYLGGGYPVINGYIDYDEKLTPDELDWLGYGYLRVALGINSKLAYDYQVLRSNVIYDDFAKFVKNMDRRKGQQTDFVKFVDFKGETLIGTACKMHRQQFLDYFKDRFPQQFNGCGNM